MDPTSLGMAETVPRVNMGMVLSIPRPHLGMDENSVFCVAVLDPGYLSVRLDKQLHATGLGLDNQIHTTSLGLDNKLYVTGLGLCQTILRHGVVLDKERMGMD